MVVITENSYAFLFDGVNDSIIVPQGSNTDLGDTTAEGHTASTFLSSNPKGSQTFTHLSAKNKRKTMAIEAWIIPDNGGVFVSKEGQFSLKIGTPDTPGPCVFSVLLSRTESIEEIKLSTALPETNGYDGTVYPPPDFGGLFEPYNRFNSAYNDSTILNLNHRPLIHVVAAVNARNISLYINGELMVKKNIGVDFTLAESDEHMYIGGKGGEFRGIMEALHISSGFDESMVSMNSPVLRKNTLALYRFNEPITPFSNTYTFNTSTSTVSGLTKIVLNNSDAKALASELTGKTITTGNIDFTSSAYSSGDYKIVDNVTTPGTKNIRSVPHVPFNLLINAGAYNKSTYKPNNTPPERVRLHSINDIETNTPFIMVSSIHLDFISSTLNNGLRPILNSRSNVDNNFVIISSDLLIDSATGYPYQPLHYATQMIDRTGQMILDESNFNQHGIVYSSRLSTSDEDTNNPFAVTWPSGLDNGFKIGHSGRHTLNHVESHEFMKMLPDPNEEIINQQVDGSPDIAEIYYDASQLGVTKDVIENQRVDIYKKVEDYKIVNVVNSSSISAIISNGLPNGHKEIIGIGGNNFNFAPFMLKGPIPQYGEINEESRLYHLRPSKESRIAVLKVPKLLNYAGFSQTVLIHYNAVDLTGGSMDANGKPYLMVSQMSPAGSTQIAEGTFLYDVIASDLANCTLYAPGGYIDVAAKNELTMTNRPHSLIGDTSEGYESDSELDFSYSPRNDTGTNYSPVNSASAQPATPPGIILSSHTTKEKHDSVFHKMLIFPSSNSNNLTDKNTFLRREPSTIINTPSNGQFDIGTTSSNTPVHEFFDIIDNHITNEDTAYNLRFFIQPSDRKRFNQLYNLRTVATDVKEPNLIRMMFLMSKARVSGISEREIGGEKSTVITAYGVNETTTNQTVSKIGSGSPDSHIVKEIEPNSPVVTVSLGGLGQGGADIKPSYDPSLLSRLPFSTQRAFHVQATSVTYSNSVGVINVTPLNNKSPDMASWGTYGFAKKGRIYLENGSNALYDIKNGTSFTFTESYSLTSRAAGSATLSQVDTSNLVVGMDITGSLIPANTTITSINSTTELTMSNSATGVSVVSRTFSHNLESLQNIQKYLDANGNIYSSFENWLKGIGETSNISLSSTASPISFSINSDPNYGEDSLSEDGTNVNDRMVQEGSDVNHDYQLGTQYASTRAVSYTHLTLPTTPYV